MKYNNEEEYKEAFRVAYRTAQLRLIDKQRFIKRVKKQARIQSWIEILTVCFFALLIVDVILLCKYFFQ